MTKEKAAKVSKALNDINDFEVFMDEVENLYMSIEGDFSDFFENELMPLMRAELANREAILNNM